MIYTFIGQPASGKTTLAKMLHEQMPGSVYLDGDELRKIFGKSDPTQHFTREWREEQTRILQRFIAYVADQGVTIIVATVNPYRNIREEFKKSRKDVVEIYVHKTDERQRESYNVIDYEAPLENFIDVNTTGHTPVESFNQLMDEHSTWGSTYYKNLAEQAFKKS
jgi:adenylylsulfate kinase